MKSSRIQILGVLAIGALLGYIAARSNTKPAANAAPPSSEAAAHAVSPQQNSSERS